MKRAVIALVVVVAGLLAGVEPAFGLGPTVWTGGANNVFSDTAVIGGTIDPGSQPITACKFEVGMESTLMLGASSHPCNEYRQSNGTTGAFVVLTGLLPLTRYYYALTASTPLGSATGRTESFMTTAEPPPPPTAQTEPATNIEPGGATINGVVNAENVALTGCEFDYGFTAKYGQTAPCSPYPSAVPGNQDTAAGLTGLLADTTYHFRVVISTEGGTADGSDETFTTATAGSGGSGGSGGGTSGDTVTTGRPTDVTATSATFNGYVDPNGASGDSCAFYFGTGTSFQGSVPCASAVAPSGRQAETANLAGLRPRTAYRVVLVLTTASGPVDGNVVGFKTLAMPTGATGRATAITATAATLNGRVDAQGASVVRCTFEYAPRRLGSAGLSPKRSLRCSPRPGGNREAAVRARLRHLRPGSRYIFRVVLTTRAGAATGATRSFSTARVPHVRITSAKIDRRRGSAEFRFGRVGVRATHFGCALAVVRRGRVRAHRFRPCRSPKLYTGLRPGRYEFLVRAGNRAGNGPPATWRFRIR